MLNRVILIGEDEHRITGKKRTRKGYIACCVKSHPFAGKDGYVFEHRLVVEQFTGHYLTAEYDVHHINGVKDNNRIENLEVLAHAEHTIKTHRGLKRTRSTRDKLSEKAKQRFRDKLNHPMFQQIPQEEMIDFYRKNGIVKTVEKYKVTKRVIYNRLHEWGVTLNNAK
ncbi:HNH endonuclease signature motif containing protein [Paenibacillus polymyxa]|uniref:HNH endonuclease signature motif containing protein n=1 Tax=Paenibacillus polymyxa TaxID=1406 RepID=UPI0003D35019|nr:HNH endonuclease signature motif containing protein [Paenibacillus polymyxa]AHC18869.1 hypothetical protein X809_06235 [Paenibacillus polymyxa CR1]